MAATIIAHHPYLSCSIKKNFQKIADYLLLRNELSDFNVNIVFTDDGYIADLNKRYRNINAPTNVLSFPFQDDHQSLDPAFPSKELGDICISVDTARKEAAEYNQTMQHRLNWLLVHGFLHLLGYDHERSKKDAKQMLSKEKQLIEVLTHVRRKPMIHLAVNVDHVATIREARGISEPDPVTAAAICELAGAKGIVVHLREDRRHIQDRDVILLRETVKTKLNLEMGATKEIIKFALDLKPDMITLVPEKRQELTTEGGLDVVSQKKKIARTIEKMNKAGIPVSLFIDPDLKQVKTSFDIGATFVELHTGSYADAIDNAAQDKEFALIEAAAEEACLLGLRVNAGHGLNYVNTARVAALDTIEELSIGHAIISRAVFTGLEKAVREMDKIIGKASSF